MEESASSDAYAGIDDVIVSVHTHGETVFQAMARAISLGADRYDQALLTEVPEGRLPLPDGRAVELPRPDAAGVAAICTFELEQTTYEADRCLTSAPRRPTKPRVAASSLYPKLDEAGYRVPSSRVTHVRQFRPRRELAERCRLHARMIDRICSGMQKTVAIEAAITILEELDAYGDAAQLHEVLDRWATTIFLYDYDRYEHLDKLAMLAPTILAAASLALTPTELTALHDRQLLSRLASSYPCEDGHVLTAEERLTAAERSFFELRGRDPLPLSCRLEDFVGQALKAERQQLRQRERSLRKGLRRSVITPTAVHDRLHRLRRAGRLPAKSKPRPFQPPADFHDIFGYNDRPQPLGLGNPAKGYQQDIGLRGW